MDEIMKGATIEEKMRMWKLRDWMLDHGATNEEVEECIRYIFNPATKAKLYG